MEYKFNYKISALDLWKLSMQGTYGSMVGVSNIIFTIAMLILGVKFWGDASNFMKILLIIGISLFTVIQPIVVYIRAKKQVATTSQDMEISFDDQGIHVRTLDQVSDIKWNTIDRIIKKPSMVIIYTSAKHGLLITNKMLGNEKEAFYDYVVSKI